MISGYQIPDFGADKDKEYLIHARSNFSYSLNWSLPHYRIGPMVLLSKEYIAALRQKDSFTVYEAATIHEREKFWQGYFQEEKASNTKALRVRKLKAMVDNFRERCLV